MKAILKEKGFLAICALVVALAATAIIIFLVKDSSADSGSGIVPTMAPNIPADTEDYDHVVVIREGTEKETIATDVIQEGLQDMGVLVTEEYYFTEAANFSDVKQILLFPAESSFLATYDGKILAGVDFSQVTAAKNDETKEITIMIPKATIQSIEIDPDSFTLYDEKNSWANPIEVGDYNNTLVELKNNAREKALQRGVLDQADKNAETVIQNFVASLMAPEVYKISVIHQS